MRRARGSAEKAYAEAQKRIREAKDSRAKGLGLSGLGLKSLPPEFGNLTSLTNLNLRNNQLTALPPELGNLTSLTWLWLDDNQLTALPPEFCNLTNLTELHLNSNQLTALPPELGNLTNLTEFELSDNPLTSPPPEVVAQGTKAVLRYLRESAKSQTATPSPMVSVSGHPRPKSPVSRRGLATGRQRIASLIGALILFISPMLPFTQQPGYGHVVKQNMLLAGDMVASWFAVLLMPLAGLVGVFALMDRFGVLRIIGVVTAVILAVVTRQHAALYEATPMWGVGVAWTGVLLVLAAGFLGRRVAPPASKSGGS